MLAYLSPLSPDQLGSQDFQDADGNPITPDTLSEGTGRVGSLSGRPTLVIKKDGQLLGYDAVCSHLGCIVRWNNAKNAIECPCHGGVFDLNGAVTAGPPPSGLEIVKIRIHDNRIHRA